MFPVSQSINHAFFFSTKGDCGDESLSEMFPYKHEDPGSSLQNPCKDKKKRGKERGKEE